MPRLAYHPYGTTGPNRSRPPFWPTDKYIKYGRQLERPRPLKEQANGITYLHSRLRLSDCGEGKFDRSNPLDPKAGYWYKLEPALAEKLEILDSVLVELYNRLQVARDPRLANPFNEQAARFMRHLWDHFLCEICPEEKTNTIATAEFLKERNIAEEYMKEALCHATDNASVFLWLRELGERAPIAEESSSDDEIPVAPSLSRRPGANTQGKPTSVPRRPIPVANSPSAVPGPSSRSRRRPPSPSPAAESEDDAVTVVPGGEMIEKLVEISGMYGTTTACPELLALNRAMERDRLKGSGGPEAAQTAYAILRGRRVALIISLISLAQRENPTQAAMKAQLSRILSASNILKDIEVGKTGPGPWQEPIFGQKLIESEALKTKGGLEKAQERLAVAYSHALDAIRELSRAVIEYSAATERVLPVRPLQLPIKRERDYQDNRPGPSRRRRTNPREEQ